MSEFEESGLFHEFGLESRVHDVAEVFDGSFESVVEKDVELALEAAIAKAGGSVQRQLPIKLASWHGQLGPIDLGLRKDDVLCGIEVKCGGSALWNCAWDAAKLATALAERKLDGAFLVAALSREHWTSRVEGIELFESREWTAEGLVSRYERRFAFWREDIQNYPKQLADRWWIVEREFATLELAGELWDIHIAEIVVDSPGLMPFAYAPIPARWKKGFADSVEPRVHPDREVDPDVTTSAGSIEEAGVIAGRLRKSFAGEGFSMHLGSSHFVAADEGTMRDFVEPEDAEALRQNPVSLKRFFSPGGRRDWLVDRGLVKGEAPDSFYVCTGSGLGHNGDITWSGRDLRYSYSYDSGSSRSPVRVAPSDKEWRSFWRELDRVGAWDWSAVYSPEEIATDGYGWEISIARGGRILESRGYEAFPMRGSWSDLPTAEWADFVAACQDLVGGRGVA